MPAPDRLIRYLGAAVAAVLLTGVGAARSVTHEHTALAQATRVSAGPTSAVVPQPLPPARAATAAAPATRRVSPQPQPRPKPKPRPRPRPRPKPVTRWLPTGTGMWLHDFDKTQGGNGRAIVARAKASGLTHLFVQTGSSRKGLIGAPALRAILPATAGTGIRVIVWDFADLRHPEADARRLANASRFRCRGCPRIAAVAPDIETAAEGTRLSTRNVIRYYTELRHWLAPDVAILATVPWPSELRVGHYPYASTAKRADALLPMAYWYNRSPAIVTQTSMVYLKQFKRPIMPVGQGYDGRLDAPYLAADPHPFASVRSFLLTAKHNGASAASLWSWDTTGLPQWTALIRARLLYRR